MAASNVAAEPAADVVPRFPTYSEDDLMRIIDEKDSGNTKKATDTAVRVFERFLVEHGWVKEEQPNQTRSCRPNVNNVDASSAQPIDWTSLDKGELSRILIHFYAEARNQKRDLYKKTTMNSLRSGLNRQLNSSRRHKGLSTVDLTKDVEFKSANDMFKAMGKKLKEAGKANIEHHPPMEITDLTTLRQYFISGINDPKVLQECVFVNLVIHFARRGRENLRQMKISDYAVTKDADGDFYLYQVTDERTKNHQDDGNKKEARMYARSDDDDQCPLRIFMKYKRKLNHKCQFLFQRPKLVSQVADKDKTLPGSLLCQVTWYNNEPVGAHTLGSMMPGISKAANLSRVYTNHSLRATSVTLLDNANQEGRHIITMTEHKSVNSLQSYSSTSEKQKKKMSNILSFGLGGNDTADYEPATSSCKKRSSSCSFSSAVQNEDLLHPCKTSCLSSPGGLQNRGRSGCGMSATCRVKTPPQRSMYNIKSLQNDIVGVSSLVPFDTCTPTKNTSASETAAVPGQRRSPTLNMLNPVVPGQHRSPTLNMLNPAVPGQRRSPTLNMLNPAVPGQHRSPTFNMLNAAVPAQHRSPTFNMLNAAVPGQHRSPTLNMEWWDDDVDDIIRQVEIPTTVPGSKQISTQVQPSSRLMQPVFNNCQVTINYNFISK